MKKTIYLMSFMLMGFVSLFTSCVEGDLYDLYDDGTEFMSPRNKKNKDYGGGGGSGMTRAQSYVSSSGNSTGISVTYKTNYSHNKLCSDLQSGTANALFAQNEISFVEVRRTFSNKIEVVGNLTPVGNVSITAHKEYSGAVFNDNSGFVAFCSGQSLEIRFMRCGSRLEYYGCIYHNSGISHTGSDYSGDYVHTHPNGSDQLSTIDQGFQCGGLTLYAISGGDDNIASQVRNIRFKD